MNATAMLSLFFSVATVFLLATILASAPNTTPPVNQEVIARIKNVQLNGTNTEEVSQEQAAVIRANDGVVEAAQKGVALYANDQLRTGSNAQISIAVEERTAQGLILIRSNSRVKLQRESLTIDLGKVFNRVKGLFRINTQH